MPSTTKLGQSGLRTQQIVEFAIWMTVAAGMWIYSYSFDRELSTYALGPVAWPRAVILLIAVVAIVSFLSDWRITKNQPVVGLDDEPLVTEQRMDGAARLRLACAILLPLVYVWLLPRAGYFAATPFFIAGYMRVLGMESWRVIFTTTIVAYSLLLLLFSKLLYIPLPTGNWPGFYDFSNWLLVLLR
jgi:hypothetical protein